MKKDTTIGIIGFGRFGTLMASVLANQAKVLVSHYKSNQEDINKAKIIGAKLVEFKTAAKADVVILAVPIVNTQAVIKQVAKYAKAGALVLDTCSVKVDPCQWLKKHIKNKQVQIMGTHPMFGPVTTKFNLKKQTWQLKNLQIVLCPLRIEKKRLEKVKSFLIKLGLQVIITTPKNHDEQNAKTLSLVHFIGRTLNRAKIGPQEIFTPGYTDLLSILPHTNFDDWQLFYDMNNYNHYADRTRKSFIKAANEVEAKIIESRAQDKFDFHRKMIDFLDTEIFELFVKRFRHVKAIGQIKKKNGLAVVDKKREAEIIKRRGEQTNLEKNFIKELYQIIFKESYKHQ